MKTWMKTAMATTLVAVTALGGTAVLARGGDCDGYGMRDGRGWSQMAPEERQARMAERFETRMARLELALALTAEQKPAWGALKQAMAERRGEMMKQMQDGPRQAASLPAPERMQRMEAMGRLHLEQMAKTRAAVETLYAQLSDAQKTVFDADFPMMGGPGGMKGHKGMHPMRGERGMQAGQPGRG